MSTPVMHMRSKIHAWVWKTWWHIGSNGVPTVSEVRGGLRSQFVEELFTDTYSVQVWRTAATAAETQDEGKHPDEGCLRPGTSCGVSKCQRETNSQEYN